MGKRVIVLFFVLTLLFSGPAQAVSGNNSSDQSVLNEILTDIYNYHVDKPSMQQLSTKSIDDLLKSLNDPYTMYFPPGELNSFTESIDGDFEGIGITLGIKNDCPVISEVLPGSPASAAGLMDGDIITGINGQDTTGQSLDDMVKKLRGNAGTTVKLKIKRNGQELPEKSITRSIISLKTVDGTVLPGHTGYIVINSFGEKTPEEFKSTYLNLKGQGIQGLIIDLRNNGGGYVDAAIKIAGYFLGSDKKVVTLVDRDGEKEDEMTAKDAGAIISGGPVVILVNSDTASASEILSGALEDYGVAKLVGTKTYGKGTVQDIISLKNGGALKLTVARDYTPDGHKFDKTGLLPDKSISYPELQLLAARRLIKPEQTVLEYNLSDSEINLDQITEEAPVSPVKAGNEVLLPLRFTLEAMGYQVLWQGNTGGINISGPGGNWNLTDQQQLKDLSLENNLYYLPVDDLKEFNLQVTQSGQEITVKN